MRIKERHIQHPATGKTKWINHSVSGHLNSIPQLKKKKKKKYRVHQPFIKNQLTENTGNTPFTAWINLNNTSISKCKPLPTLVLFNLLTLLSPKKYFLKIPHLFTLPFSYYLVFFGGNEKKSTLQVRKPAGHVAPKGARHIAGWPQVRGVDPKKAEGTLP